jgi:hypothetical protein
VQLGVSYAYSDKKVVGVFFVRFRAPLRSIEDESKGDKQVLMVISLVILFFVEKLKNSNYNLWKMHLIMKE